MKKLYYSFRNYFWYWKARQISQKTCRHLSRISTEDPAKAATILLLASVGLRIADDTRECWVDDLVGVYLTAIQREAITQAADRGYRVGLG